VQVRSQKYDVRSHGRVELRTSTRLPFSSAARHSSSRRAAIARHRVQRRRPAERPGARAPTHLIERQRLGVRPILLRASSIGTWRTSGRTGT
jgi:hypothetical protein